MSESDELIFDIAVEVVHYARKLAVKYGDDEASKIVGDIVAIVLKHREGDHG